MRVNKFTTAGPEIGILVILVLLFCALPTRAQEPLIPHTAEYFVKISVAKGTMTNTLARVESGYTASSHIRPDGWTRLLSRGELEGQSSFYVSQLGVVPTMFHQTDTISTKKGATTLTYDWTNNRLSGDVSFNEKQEVVQKTVNEEIPPYSFDSISLQYALMHDLMTDNLKPEYTLVDGEAQKLITIRRFETVSITTRLGNLDVVPVQHHAAASSRVTTFWFAPQFNYLPVKIEQYKGSRRLMIAEISEYHPVH